MNRNELLSVLSMVAKGTDRNSLIPVYEYFCFTGETVFGFSDALGVVVPYKTKQIFAIHGPTFTKLLEASKSDDIEISPTQDGLAIAAGSSEYTIPIKGADEFVWKEPNTQGFEIDYEVITGIINCIPTCSDNLALEAFNRICIKTHGPDHILCVYATDGDAITKYTTDLKMDKGVDLCLSRDFCDAITKIGIGPSSAAKMKVGPEWICIDNSPKFRLYGHNLGPTTLDYEIQINKALNQNKSSLVPIPDKLLDQALTRARVVADIETTATSIIIENKEMLIQTLTPFGDVFDSIKVSHPDIEISINAKIVQNSIQNCTTFKLTPNSSIFMGDKVLRVVGNIGK